MQSATVTLQREQKIPGVEYAAKLSLKLLFLNSVLQKRKVNPLVPAAFCSMRESLIRLGLPWNGSYWLYPHVDA